MKTHMKTAAFGCLALAAMGASAAAEEEEFFLDTNNISVEGGYMFDMGNGLSVDHLWGGNLGIGYSFAETSRSYQSLYMKLGLFAGSDTERKVEWKNEPYHYKYSQRLIPVTLGYEYHYKLTSAVNVFAGISAGGMYSSSSKKGSGIVGEGQHFLGFEDPHSSFCAAVGANLGVTYRFAPRWEWTAGVNFLQVFEMTQEIPTWKQRIEKKSTMTATVYTGITFTY